MCSPSETPGSNRLRKSIRDQVRGVVATPSGTMPSTLTKVRHQVATPSQGCKRGWATAPSEGKYIMVEMDHDSSQSLPPHGLLFAWCSWQDTLLGLPLPTLSETPVRTDLANHELASPRWASDPAVAWSQMELGTHGQAGHLGMT